MNEIRVTLAALLALVVVTGGCAKTRPTVPPTMKRENPGPAPAADPAVRVQALGRLADTYAQTSNELPGENSSQHRKLMAKVFAQLEEILPILEGPTPGAEFRQQLQVIRDAQSELATGPQDLSSDPTIDTGLRAGRDALATISQSDFYDKASLTPLLDKLSAKINDLDTVRGPLHQVVTGEAVGISSQVVSAMSDSLTKRLAETTPAASQPTTEPASAAASGK